MRWTRTAPLRSCSPRARSAWRSRWESIDGALREESAVLELAKPDWVETSSGRDRLAGEGGDDLLFAGGGDDRARGGSGNDRLHGEGGDDRLDGGGGNDTILGNSGTDILKGGSGQDELRGGAGKDELRGGKGDDLLFGNGSADTFVFRRGDGDDLIADFKVGIDMIEITGGASRFRDLDISRSGDDELIEFANVSILLEDVLPGQIDQDDFVF